MIEQIENIPPKLTSKQANYVKKQLKTTEYYKERNRKQRAEREIDFYKAFTQFNPLRSKDKTIANRKERELLRPALYKHVPKKRLINLLKNYVIPCKDINSDEEYLLTNSLLISIIDKRLRPYIKEKATSLYTGKLEYYLIKQNWKKESNNHLVWKFTIKKDFGFFIEQEIDKYRVDLLKKQNKQQIIIEICCSRQAITAQFKEKINILAKEENNLVIILAPVKLHKYFKGIKPRNNLYLSNTKTIIPFLNKTLVRDN